MPVELKKNRIVISAMPNVAKENLNTIVALNNNTYFSRDSWNKHGREFAYYLCNTNHKELSNPEPVDLSKNSFNKALNKLRVIDNYLKIDLDVCTSKQVNNFIRDFTGGVIKSKGNKTLDPKAIKYYVNEFKRFMRLYRQCKIKSNKKFNPLDLEWALNLKAPKIKREFEKFPWLSVEQLIDLGNNLHSQEYNVRTLFTTNLMGRKCEVSNALYDNIEVRKDGAIWYELPNVKKSSSEKVPVELFTFVKKPLMRYIKNRNFKKGDLLFPSREEAFAKNLRIVSEKLLKHRITPKTLRKLGVCVAEQMGYSRSDVERIGGWSTNSAVLSHYFNRKGVPLRKDADLNLQKKIHSDIYAEFDKMKLENLKLHSTLEKQSKQNAQLTKQFDSFKMEVMKMLKSNIDKRKG